MIAEAVKMYPNFKVVATTLRNAKTATINDWGAILWTGGEFYEAPLRENLEIYDRVGGGDSFASGLAYGFLEGKRPQAGGGIRRGARRAGHDHAGRHHHGNAQGSRGGDEGQGRAGDSVGRRAVRRTPGRTLALQPERSLHEISRRRPGSCGGRFRRCRAGRERRCTVCPRASSARSDPLR